MTTKSPQNRANANNSGQIKALERKLGDAHGTINNLVESMADLRIAMEDRNWTNLTTLEHNTDGIDLEAIKGRADELRAHVAAGALVKRIAELRGTYIYGDGIMFDNVSKARSAMDDLKNQEVLFSTQAQLELNRSHCTDGNIFMLVNPKTRKLMRVPINEIVAWYANPDDNEDVWYIRRQWNRKNPSTLLDETVHRWYRCDNAPEKSRLKSLPGPMGPKGNRVPVDQEWAAVVHQVNRQVGWTWGIPDLLASLQWAERYSAYLKSQTKYAEALSAIAVQYKAKTTKAAAMAQSVVRKAGTAGSAVTGDTDIIAQRGASDVNFDNGRALAAQAATGGEVSVIAALSDSGAAAGSFGAASTLDAPTYKFVSARRETMTAFFKRIFKLLGAPNAQVKWPQLEDDALHRQATMILGLWGSGLFEPEVMQKRLAEIADIESPGKVPEGVLLPQNEKSLALKAIDTDGQAVQKPSGANAQANGQGQDELKLGKVTRDDQADA